MVNMACIQTERPLITGFLFRISCRSSGVEHSLGKGEAESSILSGSTSLPIDFQAF